MAQEEDSGQKKQGKATINNRWKSDEIQKY
jgi:hypothetical protein